MGILITRFASAPAAKNRSTGTGKKFQGHCSNGSIYILKRNQFQIYYDPKTKLPTNEITERIKKYTPDFLFRDTRDNKAFLIELKPRAFEKYGEPGLIKEIAENYIRWQQVDWTFKIIYDDEIFLTHAQKEKFNAL